MTRLLAVVAVGSIAGSLVGFGCGGGGLPIEEMGAGGDTASGSAGSGGLQAGAGAPGRGGASGQAGRAGQAGSMGVGGVPGSGGTPGAAGSSGGGGSSGGRGGTAAGGAPGVGGAGGVNAMACVQAGGVCGCVGSCPAGFFPMPRLDSGCPQPPPLSGACSMGCCVRNADAGATPDASAGGAVCPTEPPASGSACARQGMTCEYGDDPRRECHTLATCNTVWQITSPRCVALPQVTCPATREEASGKACAPKDAYCKYDLGLVCRCTNCRVGGPVDVCGGDPTWSCDAPNPNPMCPAALPLLGTPCRNEGQSCVYGCGDDRGRLCQAGTWQRGRGGPCPISSREVKRDIRYLDDAELGRIARQVEAVKLARYRYKDPVAARREHLGFIIEDSPDIAAVDRDQMMVDLYGYASMLVAATQTQARELRELRREIDDLRRKIRSRAR